MTQEAILIRGGTVNDPANDVHGKCDVRLRGTGVDTVGENLSSGSTDFVVDATDRLSSPASSIPTCIPTASAAPRGT